jgi:hypothetical protein
MQKPSWPVANSAIVIIAVVLVNDTLLFVFKALTRQVGRRAPNLPCVQPFLSLLMWAL